jgi:alpha-beta hydrolase superfamily lysophospholipase
LAVILSSCGGVALIPPFFTKVCLMKTKIVAAFVCLVSTAIPVSADAGRAASDIEAPELGRRGDYAVGTVYRDIMLGQRITLTAAGAEKAARTIGLRFWYPATAAKGAAATYRHAMVMPDKSAHEVVEHGSALEGALETKGKFPLVVISHGFGGWSEHLSRLGEHLASRGYIVIAIDHRDMPFDSAPGFMLSFGKVLNDRSLDQQQVIRKLTDPTFSKSEPALGSADNSKIALIGYSMGGFGALGTSGALYNPVSKPFSGLPVESRTQAVNVDAKSTALVDSVVLIAPWGGQPDNRAWLVEGIAKLSKPTLFIAGDHDDIVNYRDGVRWLFDSASGSDRYMLVYREARHNVAGNPVELGDNPSVDAMGFVREPVWRQDRLNQINQHFVTAFLDLTLKADTAKRSYLDVPTPVASDGKWPVTIGTKDGVALASDKQPDYWRGFQRRWAIGLELQHKKAGQ